MKKVLILIFSLLQLVFINKAVKAQLITIGKDGTVTSNVLAYESDSEKTVLKKIAQAVLDVVPKDLPISMTKDGGKLSLNIVTNQGETSYDVTNIDEKIIEFEDRPQVKRLYLAKNGSNFVIGQGSIRAETSFQVNVDPKDAKITLLTPTGYKFLKVVPQDAINVLFRSQTISRLSDGNSIAILEDETGNLHYDVHAKKDIKITDFYTYNADVEAKVSAVNAEVISVKQSFLTKLLSFIFA